MIGEKIRIEIEVIGMPQTAGSKRAYTYKRKDGTFGARVDEDCKRSKTWRSQIVDAVRTQYTGPLLRGPLRVSMTFYRPRPKGHFGSGRNADKLKPNAPEHPTTKPDLTKYLRCAEDALKGVLWSDDSIVVRQENAKEYGEPARAVITVEEI